MRKILLLLSFAASAIITQAQPVYTYGPEDSTKPKVLDAVVVTGQYKPQSVKNSVYQVKVIGKEQIQNQGATRLQDVLKNELNMRFSQDLATGGSGITMMGLTGQNVKILVDGLPVTGRQGINNEFDISQIDVNAVERIEIVEGPMSVIYGADALAGVINIITKKAGASAFSVNARIHEESVGREYGLKQGIHNQQAGLTWKHKRWEAGGSLAHNFFGGWRDTAVGRELVWHKKDQRIANGFLAYNNGRLSLRYRIDGLDEVITNPGNYLLFPDPISGDTLAYDQEYLSRRIMQQLQGTYFVNGDLSFQWQTAYTDYQRQVYSTTINKNNGDLRLDPGEGKQSIVNFTGLTFRGTALYKLSDLVSFQPGVDINLDRGEGERLKSGKNAVDDYAFFLTSEITPSSKISLRPGLRFIRNSVYDAPPLIPSLNTKFALTKDLDLRLSYARGFRAPSLRELYFSFFDANHQVIGNPDLEAETSNSFTGSLNLARQTRKGISYKIQLGGFYNDVKNRIDYIFTPSSDTAKLYNVLDSKTAGLNVTGTYLAGNWNLSAGFAHTGFYNEFAVSVEDLPVMTWAPEANLATSYRFSKIGLDLNVYYKFTGRRPRYISNGPEVVLSKQDAFHLADLTAGKKLFKLLTLTAGVRNLFNESRINSTLAQGGIHSGGSLNVGTGRSYFASLAFNWNK